MSDLRVLDSPAPAPVRGDIVDVLRELLAEAENGEFVSVIAVLRRPRGPTTYVRVGVNNTAELIGELFTQAVMAASDGWAPVKHE